MNMRSSLPSQKVTAGFLAGLAADVLIEVLNQYVVTGNPIPSILHGSLVLLASSVASYFVRPSSQDVAKVEAH